MARSPTRNIIPQLPENVEKVRNLSIPVDPLLMLTDKNILSNIVNYRNIYITNVAETFHQEIGAKGTTVNELKVLIRLLYFVDLHKYAHVNVSYNTLYHYIVPAIKM